MTNYSFNYSFNVSGNCNAAIKEIAENVDTLNRKVRKSTGFFDELGNKLLTLTQGAQYLQNLNQAIQDMNAPGAALNASMADLAAISGAAGQELKTIEQYARNTAKAFGISASQAVESYKLLLSQLSPELTKNSEALNAMGTNIAILSKTMGGDARAAAEVLTTAMNQYGVSLADPMEASRKMAEMMNIMAAAGREGSAELPAIKVALEQCGMAAKAAGVSFAETNAAIQVLDKAGKKGSEGGVALRNVMTTLARGRFLPKDIQKELTAAGVNIYKLTDNTKSLTERLRLLQPVMQDQALFSKLFGRENVNAAMALVQGIDKVDQWTEAISGTNTAVEQSQIIMDTYNERLARVQARFDDLKISIFKATGDMGVWFTVISQALIPVSQLVPLFWGLFKAMAAVKALNWAGMWKKTLASIVAVQLRMNIFKYSCIQAGGAFQLFRAMAVSACRAISVAIMNIPIVGWIAAGIAAVIALIQLLWNKCKGFRVAIFTALEAIKAIGRVIWQGIQSLVQRIVGIVKGIVDKIKSFINSIVTAIKTAIQKVKSFFAKIGEWVAGIFSKVWEKLSKFLSPFVEAFRKAANMVKGFFSKIFNWFTDKLYAVINWFIDKYNWVARKLGFDEIARLGRERAEESWANDHPEAGDKFAMPEYADAGAAGDNGGGTDPISGGVNGIGGTADKSDRIKNINITIDRLIDKFTIETTNMKESSERIRDMVAEALLSAVNDVNLAVG